MAAKEERLYKKKNGNMNKELRNERMKKKKENMNRNMRES